MIADLKRQQALHTAESCYLILWPLVVGCFSSEEGIHDVILYIKDLLEEGVLQSIVELCTIILPPQPMKNLLSNIAHACIAIWRMRNG